MKAPIYRISRRRTPVREADVGDEERLLNVGEWSDWVPIEFELIPSQTLHAEARFYLKQLDPDSSCMSAR